MQNFIRSSSLALASALLVWTTPAFAHISLLEPAARYDGSLPGQSKACPCGVGESNRFCDLPDDRSDPDRSNNVTVLEAGSTVTLRFDEYVGHSGRYRVAFDDDGADLADFNANILEDIPDPVGATGNAGGSIWEITVTVPDVICDNCTLQLIQVMDGDMSSPVPDPVGRSSYYQCADIEIVAPGTGGDDMGMPPADMGTDPDPADMGGTVTPPVNTDMGGTTTPPQNMPPVMPGPDAGGDAGYASVHGNGSCATAAPSRELAPLVLVLAVVALRRRRG